MNHYPTKPLRVLIAIEKGRKAPEVLRAPTATSLRYLQIDDLRPGARPKYCEPFDCPRASKSDAVIAWDGANAGTVSCDLDGYIGSTLSVLRPLPASGLSAGYLSRFLESRFGYLQETTTGAAIPHLSKEALTALEIPLPPLEEQERMSRILGAADELRGLREQADCRTADLIPALFYEMFGDPATNPKRLPTAVLDELIVDGPQNGLYKHSSAYGEGTPILRIDGFYGGSIDDLSGLKRLRLTSDEISKYRLQAGDLVINRVNSPEYLGKSALVPMLQEPTVFESNMMRFAVDPARVDPLFLINHLQCQSIKQQIAKKAKHAIHQSSINQEDVKSLRVVLPHLDLQRHFAARVAEIRALQIQQAESRRRLDDLFQSMLHRAFQGEL